MLCQLQLLFCLLLSDVWENGDVSYNDCLLVITCMYLYYRDMKSLKWFRQLPSFLTAKDTLLSKRRRCEELYVVKHGQWRKQTKRHYTLQRWEWLDEYVKLKNSYVVKNRDRDWHQCEMAWCVSMKDENDRKTVPSLTAAILLLVVNRRSVYFCFGWELRGFCITLVHFCYRCAK